MRVLGVVAGALWLLCLWRVAGAVRSGGLLGRLRRLVGAAFWGGLAAAVTLAAVFLATFHAFSDLTLVAEVRTQRTGPRAFSLHYHPVVSWAGQMDVEVPLRGDQWAVSGGVVTWSPWLTLAGLKSYHRPLRILGQFSRLDEQRREPPTVYALTPGVDRFWELLYWLGQALPLVDAVYGASAYAYVEPQAVQAIYVSPSGYVIKRRSP